MMILISIPYTFMAALCAYIAVRARSIGWGVAALGWACAAAMAWGVSWVL